MTPVQPGRRLETTSTTLLAGMRAGDEAAWVRMVNLYGPLVYSWCRRSGVRDEDAKDLVQQVFAKAFTGLASFRKENPHDTFRGWLWTVTRHAICDHCRAPQNRSIAAGGTAAWERMKSLPDPALAESEPLPTDGQSDLLTRALALIRNEFSEAAMKAFDLTVLQGLSSTEAAHRLQATPEAVRKSKSRILRRLREELGDVE